MLYPITRPLARIALSVFFRRLYLSGLENVDWEKPVILAANHPTAFLEPCILACWLPKPLHFMVRGDLFLKPLSNWVLRDFNMIPMFRMSDAGVKGVKANFRSVQEAADVLHTHHPVLILAEGSTAHEKRLRPLQKGTARIALGTESKDPSLGIQLIPVGVNYTYADRFRSEVMIHFGEPIMVGNYLYAYRENAANTLRNLTEALRAALEKNVVIIHEEGDEVWAEEVLEIYRNNHADPFSPHTIYNAKRLADEKRITCQVNNLREPEKSRWKSTVEYYIRELKRYKASDRALKKGASVPWASFFVLLILAPVYLLALLLHGLPLGLARYIGYGKRVPRYEFKASVTVAAGLVLYIIWTLLLFLLGTLLWTWWVGLLLVVLGLGAAGWLGLFYRHHWKKWSTFRAYRRIPADARKQLLEIREEIGVYFQA